MKDYIVGELMSDEDSLAHYGVKGMRWGRRKAQDSGGSSDHSARNRALKIGGGVLVAAGAAVAIGVLAKNGKLPVGQLMSAAKAGLNPPGMPDIRARATTAMAGAAKNAAASGAKKAAMAASVAAGQKAAAQMADNANWKKSVKSVMDDMAEANAEQDAWMRSMGLGAAVNKKDN